MLEDTGWKCKQCGYFNTGTFVCAECGNKLVSVLLPNRKEQTPNVKLDTGHAESSTMSSNQPSQGSEETKIIITCEKCGQKLRVPLRKKNLHVACPNCRHEFNYQFVEGELIGDSPGKRPLPSQPNISNNQTPSTIPQTTETRPLRCPNCGGYKVAVGDQLLDLILVVMTFGLWLIVEILRGPKIVKPGDKCRCEICGNQWIYR